MAAKNTSIALGKPFTDFIQAKVATGEFATGSEVVREAMRRFVEDEERREALDLALKEGLNSGPAVPFDLQNFLLEMREKHRSAA
jgi:antitoxin ParD1/3/4